MKKEIRQIILIIGIAWGGIAQSQIRIANNATNIAVPGSSAFIDASSNPTYNSTTNVGKGLLYPRVDLTTFTSFGGTPIGISTSFPAYYDGFVVYNTNAGGVAGVGTTQGTLTSGFWYYDNKSGTINGGTWKPFTAASSGVTTNMLSSSGNTITSNVNGISSTAPAVNTNALSLSGSSLTSTVNGIASNAVNLAPAITAATTNLLSSSGNTMTSTVNGIARTAPIINSVTNTVSGNTLTTTVNGISSSSVTLPQGVNIYNSDGVLTNHRVVSMNRKELFFSENSANNILFDVGSTFAGNIRLYSVGSVASVIRAGVGSSRMLDMDVLSNGTSRIMSAGNTELFIGTTTNSAPLILGAGNTRAILTGSGNFGIGTTSPSQKLDVIGNIRATGSLISGTTTYPDYVFEGYFNGFSKINPAYQFKKLDEVENFIKEKGHLPGYQSLEEVKQKDMMVDITQNSITNMEKIEELYLHVIELSKEVKELREKNEQLEKYINKINDFY
ncbi:hypothetical protein [Chryseobacterium lathyri]|uniref:Peptidase S74 domain-containing protein n=1 Tax=Chryseobacterium lathyri TaxID=395933 RepID=A0A511YFR7_9FLAO|nr:hypothetical protein [Chryseobacterium lathyri]GEN74047.1 hypothetical protein CLA01_41190 [Chryseobacterium lathyri]